MTLNIKDKPKDGFERVVYAEEDKFNFYSVIAIHNTKRGPALGGCRYFNYQDFIKQEEDVLKLAEAMTYKNSLAELPFGGGKATIHSKINKKDAYSLFGEVLNKLNGTYITAGDMGTVDEDLRGFREYSDHVCNPIGSDSGLGTALGVYYSMLGCVEFKFGQDSLVNKNIFIKGYGKTGSRIASLCKKDGANIETWLSESNLDKDKNGFIVVDNNLLSTSDKNIFVTGDACTVEDNFRPKSGVMAVRQGQVLKENIFAKLTGTPLIKFKAQKNWLYLIGTHKNKALLNYFFLSFHGRWCWKLKNWIDRGFINKFKFTYNTKMSFRNFELEKPTDIKMYCQGCGSKVSKNTLVNFLNEENSHGDLPDSSLINTNSSSLLQSIDHIKLFTSLNPFDFGIISYLHSQNDILSSGGAVETISVSQGLPFSEGIIESFFMEYFMKGIKSEALKDGSIIASGHSYQSKEPGITITMNGSYEKQITKSQAQENELIYLSKPLGTGYLLAAYFNNSELLSSFDFQKLMTWMKKGNKKISEISKSFKSKITTDISGFGLASHLSDICKFSGLSAEIKLNEEILINKNIEILNKFKSTGFENNYSSSANEISISDNNKLQNILYDPQTNGPLLISIEKEDQIKFEKEFQSVIGFRPLLIGHFKKFQKKLINVIN